MPSPSPVQQAINFMWERYSEPLSLTDIARSAALSRFHFSRVFKESTGMPPGQFLTGIRMHQAKCMLLTTSMNVADVAVAVGYTSLTSFTNRFTCSVGISPSGLRREALRSTESESPYAGQFHHDDGDDNNQKKNTTIAGMVCPATVLSRAMPSRYPDRVCAHILTPITSTRAPGTN
jgi:AraC-like DNA-binding protein